MSLSSQEPVQTPPSTPSRNGRSSSAKLDSGHDSGVEGLSSNESSPTRAPRKKTEEPKAGPEDSDYLSAEDSVEDESVAKNPFPTERGRILFEAIDELQAFECSKALDIPQLIVVGGQSSGKSSLLQSLTGIPFPVGANCCTRFPTRITSKRTAPKTKDSFRITIEPAEVIVDGLAKSHEMIKEYECTGETFTAEIFVEAANEVSSKYMGIRQGKDADSNNFAAEVLKVELSGPDRPYFSILDLPGHFNSTYEVNKSDQAKIEAMIVEYMKKSENTVICVLDASNDLAHQPILQLAHENIQDRGRVLGVFTKCDRLRNNVGEAENAVSIALGKSLPKRDPRFMPRGWFVVRNRSDNDTDRFEFEAAEKKLFRLAPWTEVPTKRRGATALKAHLGEILDLKIKSSFPAIRENIGRTLEAKMHERHVLGEPRGTHDERRHYVTTIVRSYEEKMNRALNHPGRLKNPKMELRRRVKSLNKEFDSFMRAKGANWEFQDYDMSPKQKLALLSNPVPEGQFQQNASRQGDTFQFDSGFKNCSKTGTSASLLQTIEDELIGYQASQLPGIINPDIFPAMYQLQVAKWLEIAQVHIYRVRSAAGECGLEILDSVCSPAGGTARLSTGLKELLAGYFIDANNKTNERCRFLCDQETKCKMLQTTDPKFEEDIIGWRRVRFQQAGLLGMSRKAGKSDVEALNSCFDLAHPTIQKNMVNEVHDVLKVYYKISLETFVRSITTAVEAYVSGEDSPVMSLRPENIMALSEEHMERLAGEDPSTLRRREVLHEEIVELTKALEIVDTADRRTRDLDRD